MIVKERQTLTYWLVQINNGTLSQAHTKLGWVLSGPVNYEVPSSTAPVNMTSTHVSNHPDPDLLESKLELFWSLGIVLN